MSKRDRERHDRYFQVHHYMMRTDAWRALSAPARAIYVQIGFRYDGSNNGKIAYSVRDAASECNVHRDTAARAFKELVDLGFVEETRHGALSRKTRVASEWRLTAFKCDLTGALKTCLFMQRATRARASRQSRSRSPRLSQTSASPVLNEGRECPKTATSLSQTSASQSPECPKRAPVEVDSGGSPVLNEGTHIIYHPQGDPETTPDTGSTPAIEPQNSSSKPFQTSAAKKSRPAASRRTPDSPALIVDWSKPVVRELFGEEARERRIELAAPAQ